MKSIEETVTIGAPPSAIFEALLDSERFSAFTGEPATIDRKIGGKVSAFGGKIGGINLDVVDGKRIVQAWRTANMPEGTFTLATFELSAEGAGTKLTFSQHAVPETMHAHLAAGWGQRYWTPLRKYLEKQ